MTRWLILVGFLLAGAAVTAVPAQAQGTRIALVIANANYPDDNTPLKQPLKDASAISAELKRNGFEVDTRENLTRLGMQEAIDAFKNKIKPGATALLFYSGYALQASRQNFLIPVNAQIWAEGDVKRDGIGLEGVLDEMNVRGAKTKIVILDASRKNPFERRFRGFSGGLASVNSPRGTLMISAALPGQVANEGNGENSLFIGELLKELRTPNASAEDVFTRTRIGVSRATNGEQVPWVSSSLSEEFQFGRSTASSSGAPTPPPLPAPKAPEIAVAPPPPPAPAPAPKPAPAPVAAPAPPPPPPAVDADLKARQDCTNAQQLNTRKGWEDFLAAHPSGFCSDTARDQIAALDKAAPPVKPQFGNEGKDDRALQDLNARVAKNASDADAYYRRGQLYAQRGDNDRALADFGKAVELNPKDAEAWNNRCWLRAVKGELQAALADCDKSLGLQPNFADAFDSRGFVRLKMNDYARAIADYNSALRGNPEQASALFGRGKAKVKSGDTAGGNADIAAAKTIKADIDREFAGYGIQ